MPYDDQKLFWIIVLPLMVAQGIYVFFFERKVFMRKMEKTFVGRTRLTDEQFFETYFQSRGVPREIAVKVRNILQEALDADMSRLSAEDDFSGNIKFVWDFDSMSDVRLVRAIEEQFGIKITDKDASKMKTIRDIVEIVWQKVKERGDVGPVGHR